MGVCGCVRAKGGSRSPALEKDANCGRGTTALATTSPVKTHCAHRGRWYSCGCPGQCPCIPRPHFGVLGRSTHGSASVCSRAHRPTTCSTGSSCHPLDERQAERRRGSQPGKPVQCSPPRHLDQAGRAAQDLAMLPGPGPSICTPSSVQLALMTHANDVEAWMTPGAAWLSPPQAGCLSSGLVKGSQSNDDPSDPKHR